MTDPGTVPRHEFVLLHFVYDHPEPRFDDARYDRLRSAPPAGCVAEDLGGLFGLRCERSAPTLLDAVAEVTAEVRAEHGFQLTDLGVEKVWEWSTDGPDGFGATILAHLLLMASYRAELLGYRTEDLVRFLRAVGPPAAWVRRPPAAGTRPR